MQLVIRRYCPSDNDAVLTIFRDSIQEYIANCFHGAISNPLYLAITLALCVAGYLLCSVLGAVVLPGVWVGLVYYCCREVYVGSIMEKHQVDMQDIPLHYLSRPDDCFWVAEAEADGRAQIVGMVAVAAKQNGKEKYGELLRMIISPSCRRMGLGFRMGQTVVNFCKERSFSEVMLETNSTRPAALALYRKLGFKPVHSYTPSWIHKLAKISIIIMKKHL